MSDVAVSSPAPVTEVPISDPAPHVAPLDHQPLPPEKPHGRQETVRETLERAFKKAGTTDKPEAKHAKRGMGDNNPPEPMEEEKLDLRKPPPKDDGRPRAEHGHFAAVNKNQGLDPQQSPGGAVLKVQTASKGRPLHM